MKYTYGVGQFESFEAKWLSIGQRSIIGPDMVCYD